MRRMIFLSLFALAVFSMAAGVLAQDDLQPEIFLPQIRHDFGDVFEQDKYEHDFIVQNRGKADLIIERVKPG